jgi:hypothetical protein
VVEIRVVMRAGSGLGLRKIAEQAGWTVRRPAVFAGWRGGGAQLADGQRSPRRSGQCGRAGAGATGGPPPRHQVAGEARADGHEDRGFPRAPQRSVAVPDASPVPRGAAQARVGREDSAGR